MIENILILDTETTGLDPKRCQVIEVGAVLYNLKHKAILQAYSSLIPCVENPVEHINKISQESTNCVYPANALNSIIGRMSNDAEVCVAHNALFDMRFLKTLPCGDILLNKKWICTKENFTWPVKLTRLRLEDVCIAMDVPYVNAHRALSDCFLLAQCFGKVDDLDDRFNNLAAWIFSDHFGDVCIM
jgi:DNA polymerase-3 subunit epsilon